MEGFCRACLIKYDDPAELLQYTEKNRRLFVYSTGLQVKRNDSFTFQLCRECYLNMKISCKFKKQCRTSDRRFKSYLSMKDVGNPIDFCTFIKTSDDTLTFRLPMSGSSTPANQRNKDDDNESTCTSIRNFMTDILQGEEMPDTEARIIREVIEEEADVLDDSLDSHWLQDDVSVDTDFRLDFSFSPFSTPRSENNDHCYTPLKLTDQKDETESNYLTSKEIIEKAKLIDKELGLNDVMDNNDDDLLQNEMELNDGNVLIDQTIDFCIPSKTTEEMYDKPKTCENFSMPLLGQDENDMELLMQNEKDMKSIKIQIDSEAPDSPQLLNLNFYNSKNENYDKTAIKDKTTCTIDRNLEDALKDEANNEFCLDDLLVTPVYHVASGASTPTINNILFGEKLELDTNTDENIHEYDDVDGEMPKFGQCIEKYEEVQGSINIIDEFFDPNSKDFEIDNDISDDILDNLHDESKKVVKLLNKEDDLLEKDDEKKYDVENCKCIMCNKKFKSIKALRIHFTKLHNIKIEMIAKAIIKKKYNYKPRMCHLCGKSIICPTTFKKHVARHKEEDTQTSLICDICSLECTSKSKLKVHMASHGGIKEKKDTGKKLVCPICGLESNVPSNFKLHMRRHNKEYTKKCDECGRGFYRSEELKLHIMRVHQKDFREKISCTQCDKILSCRLTYIQHLKIHADDRKFECQYCGAKFVSSWAMKNHLKTSVTCIRKRDKLPTNKAVDTEANVTDKEI